MRLHSHAVALCAALTLSSAAAPARAASAPPLAVQILDATTKGQVVPGAQVIFQRDGQTSLTGTTGADGKVRLDNTLGADDPSVTLIVKKEGYSSLVVRCPCAGLSYAVSPTLGQQRLDAFRVVLNWGRNPQDLDLHGVYRGNHVFFSHKTGADAFLDVDDTDGYGPETLTISKRHTGDKYVFAIHNYSAQGRYGTDALAKSGAKVFVYAGESLIKSYYVPTGKKGALWVLFALDGDGALTDIDKLVDVAEADKVGPYLQQMTERTDFGIPMHTASAAVASAAALHRDGLAALAAGRAEDAIIAFQRAVAFDPNLAVAYVDLGRAYTALGRPAEAGWATKKAAELGRLPAAAGLRVPNDRFTLRASSFLKPWKHYTFAPENLIDDDLWTSWQPNRTPRGGVGESFDVTFTAAQTLTGFEVFNGFRLIDDLGDLYAMNNRIENATVTFSDGTTFPLHFEDRPEVAVLLLPTPKTCTGFKVTVDSIYRGTKWNDLAVSEFHPLSKGD